MTMFPLNSLCSPTRLSLKALLAGSWHVFCIFFSNSLNRALAASLPRAVTLPSFLFSFQMSNVPCRTTPTLFFFRGPYFVFLCPRFTSLRGGIFLFCCLSNALIDLRSSTLRLPRRSPVALRKLLYPSPLDAPPRSPVFSSFSDAFPSC